MKRAWIGWLAWFLSGASLPLGGQDLAIGLYTVGGGGVSEGGSYALHGTAGQAVSAGSEGGPFRVGGGLWGFVAVVPSPGAPPLELVRDTEKGLLLVRWTLPDDDWVLVESSTLGKAPEAWALVDPSTYQSDGPHRLLHLPQPMGRKFYRLRRR